MVVGPAGEISLDREAFGITIGFPYEHRIWTLSIEPPAGERGASFFDKKHLTEVNLRLYRSYSGDIFVSGEELCEEIPYPRTDLVVGNSFKLYRGEIDVSPSHSSSRDIKVGIVSNAPYPFEVLALGVAGENNDQ